MPTIAEVRLWGRRIAAVSWDEATPAVFQYDPEFARSGIEVAPLVMPLAARIYTFLALPLAAFHGLPGLLANSLPDRFGNALIDAWLATQGRTPESFNPVERLCYIGARGMGALEFAPATGPRPRQSAPLRVDALVALASDILSRRTAVHGSFTPEHRHGALQDILRVGTSAGGARAKAIIAWNPDTQEVRSGELRAPAGFGYWLLKFDGVSGNRDKELEDPQGYTAIEYAYSLMARTAGIGMSECRLLEEGGRRHFMTRRFDRTEDGRKIHMQSLAALTHLDFNAAGAHSYEQCFAVIKRLGLPMASLEEQFRRMLFNIVARNQDDHVKNIAFLMNQQGEWSLAPAFDVTYAYNPQGRSTQSHQMTLNGKQDGFTLEDFRAGAASAGLKRGRAETILDEVRTAVLRWPEFAQQAAVRPSQLELIRSAFRLDFPGLRTRRSIGHATGSRAD
ncbi:MAG: type II toxin-antitoxin system HipA family toxin [Steroidobacteraceae bacterium]